MTTKHKKKGKTELNGKWRMRAEIVELTQDMHSVGLVSGDELAKTTLRMLGPNALPKTAMLTGKEIVAIRERAHMSQAVFARLIELAPQFRTVR